MLPGVSGCSPPPLPLSFCRGTLRRGWGDVLSPSGIMSGCPLQAGRCGETTTSALSPLWQARSQWDQ